MIVSWAELRSTKGWKGPTPSGNRHSHTSQHELKIDPTICQSKRQDHVSSGAGLSLMRLYLIWPHAPLDTWILLGHYCDGTELSLVHSWAGVVTAQLSVYTAIVMLVMLESQRYTEPIQVSGSWTCVLSW